MSHPFQLVTDSSCDLSTGYLEQEEIVSLPLSFTIDGETYQSGEMDLSEFYRRMREGAMPITSAVNIGEATSALEGVLRRGLDILYIGFSSGMSSTFQNVKAAADDLRGLFPERKIVVIDSLSVTLGQGLLVMVANEMKKAGGSLDRAAAWVREHLHHVTHYVTTSDIKHLHRGGRVSRTTATIGSLLGIQPMVSLNAKGEAIMTGVKRGRKNAMDGIINSMKKAVGNRRNDFCCIAHTDCEEDAFYLRDRAMDVFGIQKFVIEQAGPVLGAHTGPGALAMCMLADYRPK